MQLPQVQIPNFVGTLGQVEAIQQSRLQALAARQALEESQRFNAALPELTPALMAGEGPAYDAAVARLGGMGARGLQVALPLMQDARLRREFQAWQGGGGQAPAAPAAAPAAPMAPTEGGNPQWNDRSLPRGIRNNNPLNLSFVAGQPGVQGSDGRFGRYNTMEEGVAAATRQLQMYGQRGLTSVEQIIGRWAPPNENNTGAYVATVARELGVDPRAPLNLSDPMIVSRLVGAMARMENGRPLDPAVAARGVQLALAGGAAPSAGAATPVSAPGAAPQPRQGIDPAELRRIEMGLASPNPMIQRAAQARLQMLQLQQRDPTDTFREETRNIGGRQVAGQVNLRTGQFSPYPGQTGQDSNGGPFAGTSMDAQNNNIVLRLADRIRAGTATPEEQRLYQRAYTALAEGQIQFVADPSDPTGSRQIAVRVPRSMGDLPAPGGAVSAPPAQATVPAAAASGAGVATPAVTGATVAPNDAMAAGPAGIPGLERIAPPPAGFQRRGDGSLEPIPGGPQDQTRQPLSEAQARANMFGGQMLTAEDTLRNVRQPSGAAIALWRNAPELAVNPALSSNDQQYFNAVRLFAAGVLRKETGAAFTAPELLDVHSRYFPQPGDSAETVAQKARARQQVIESIRAEIPGGFRGIVQGDQAGPGGRGVAESPGRGEAPRRIRFNAQGQRVE